jgi:phosphoribosylformylglycinamidine (FGAM) synthase-like enzyme
VKKLVAGIAVAVAASLAVVALAFGASRTTVSVEAKLTAKQEVPAQVVKDTKAKGLFTGKLDGRKLTWKLTFSGLTGPATQAHIHMGAMGKAGNVVVVLCNSTCKSGVHGKQTISRAVKKALLQHKLYVNVHTAKNPNGEIRGQLAKM